MSVSIFGFYPLSLYENGYFASIDEAFKATKALGINTAEAFTFEFEKYPLADYSEFLKRNDISLKTIIITSPFTVCEDSAYKCEIDKIKKIAEEAEKEGAEYIMVVPDSDLSVKSKEAVTETMLKGLDEVTAYVKNSSLTAMIENFSLNSHPYSTISELEYIFKNIPELKLTYDPANFYCIKEDPEKAYEALKGSILHAHGKDWIEKEGGSIVRPGLPVLDGCAVGSGILPLDKIVDDFKKDGYNGQFVIEINSNVVTFEDIKKSTDFLRGKLDA